MLRSIKNATEFNLHAKDGEIGNIKDFFFDDEKWVVRYMVVHTGSWLLGRDVLISPYSFSKVDWNNKRIEVALSREHIKNSPDIDTDQPISRQKEMEYLSYYGYPIYWGGPGMWGDATYPAVMAAALQEKEKREKEQEFRDMEYRKKEKENHLRSIQEVGGYSIEAIDDSVGHVEDFIIEEESWCIRYIVVDTRNILPGKTVILSPEWIKEIDWGTSKVVVDLAAHTIKSSPEIDPDKPISRKDEEELYDHYDAPRYW
jgi:hypothetical protein